MENSGQANIQLGTEQVAIIVEKSTLLKRNLLYYIGALESVLKAPIGDSWKTQIELKGFPGSSKTTTHGSASLGSANRS